MKTLKPKQYNETTPAACCGVVSFGLFELVGNGVVSGGITRVITQQAAGNQTLRD
jgi:hypothetical protein